MKISSWISLEPNPRKGCYLEVSKLLRPVHTVRLPEHFNPVVNGMVQDFWQQR